MPVFNQIKKVLASLMMGAAVLLSESGNATTAEYIEIKPRMEISFSLGSARQTGYLTEEDAVGAYSFGLDLEYEVGMMSFEWSHFSAAHNTGEFALQNDKDVRVTTYSFIPSFRIHSWKAWRLYAGLGLNHVRTVQEDPDFSTTYGSFIFSGLARYQWNERWSVHYKTQWYNVEQTIQDQNTSFEVWNNFLGVAYDFM